VLFGIPDDREPECYLDATGLAASIDWTRQRFRGALAPDFRSRPAQLVIDR
jgi:hypothetical protein